MKKVVVSAVVILLAVAAFWFSGFTRNDSLGTIDIIVINELGETIVNDTYDFVEEDTLFDILNENYELGCADNSYHLTDNCGEKIGGRVLLKIEDVESDWLNNFIAIYINDEYSTLGIDNISLHDSDIYRFEYTEVGDEN